MNHLRVVAVLVLGVALALWAMGCTGEDEGVTCADMCTHQTDCSGDMVYSDCMDMCTGMNMDSACGDVFMDASCATLNSDAETEVVKACFPACSGDGATCEGDSIRLCMEGHEYLFGCGYVCKSMGGTYAGTCGDNANGQPSSTGDDVCWCEGI